MHADNLVCLLTFQTLMCRIVSGFLFENCLSLPCQCVNEYIKCDNRSLPRIPSFSLSKQYSMVFLHLQHNRLFVVPSGAFRGIKTVTMYLDLSYNDLHDIHDEAFDGIDSAITILRLNDNDLTMLPLGIANLTNLVYLDVQNNPIKTFDNHVFPAIGSHLEVLSMGSKVMTEWPKEMENLTQLNTFHISGLPFRDIPDNAFGSFAVTLRSLIIANSNLVGVPTAICDLRYMDDFSFIGNTNLTKNDTIMPNCITPLTATTSARFERNDLLEFPDVLKDFPNLLTLYVVGNVNLGDINITMTPQNYSKLTNLYLSNNNFYSIPADLYMFHELHYLNIQGNKIKSLKESDITGLINLMQLNLNDNPIADIDSDAFRAVPELSVLRLDNTNITAIPEAINGTVSLRTISLKNDKINCTCDALMWMKDWQNLNSATVSGTCNYPNHGTNIADYLISQFPNC